LSIEVRRATAADRGWMAEVLAGAFATDPPMRWFIPDERRRVPLLRAYFRDVVGLYEAHATDGGVALWAPPGAWPPPLRAVARPYLRTFGRWPLRGIAGSRTIERGHPHEPVWLLDYIAVDAGRRGQGIGSALLEAAPDGPKYLHAGSERSRDLYLRHGWRLTERFTLPFGGPPLWRMRRD
jgi:GNAT superfamily N-acetyltransferase